MPREAQKRIKVSAHVGLELKRNGYYYALVRRNGAIPQEISMKTKNREEAIRKVRDAKLEELAAAKWAGALTSDVVTRLTVNRKMSLNEAAQNWLATMEQGGYARTTIKSTRDIIERFLVVEKLNDEPTAALELRHADHFINRRMLDQKLSSRRRAAWAINAFAMALFQGGMLPSNPVANLSIRTEGVSQDLLLPEERKPLTLAEIDKLLAETERGSFWWAAVIIVYETGIRLADVVNLQWASMRDGWLELMTEKARVIVKHKITPKLRDVFSTIERRTDSGYLFAEQKAMHDVYPSTLSQQFRRLCIKCGIMDKSFHSLRHTFAMRKELEERESIRKQLMDELIAEMALKNTQQALGHRSVESTKGYLNHPKV